MDRIIGAFTFRKGVYAEVERDTSFTTTAWIIVVVVSFLNQLGGHASLEIGDWFLGTIIGTIFNVIAFAIAAFVINLVGRSVYNADVNFNELVRTLGLAYVWQVIGLVGIIGLISPTLLCLLSWALIIGWLVSIIAMFVAVKEALDLEWVPTIITVVLGFLVIVVANIIVGLILGAFGLGAAILFGAFS